MVQDMQIKTPSDILADNANFTQVDGLSIRKGTIKATIDNVALLNELLQEAEPASMEKARLVVQALEELVPSLRALGVFDLFSPQEWLTDPTKPGRVILGLLYFKLYEPSQLAQTAETELSKQFL